MFSTVKKYTAVWITIVAAALAGGCYSDTDDGLMYDEHGMPVKSESLKPAFGVEEDVIGIKPGRPMPDPASKDYLAITSVRKNHASKLWFNAQDRDFTDEVAIAGKTVVIEKDNNQNIWNTYNNREDISRMTIDCDVLIIRDAFNLPQTDIEIHANQIRFENARANINTTPKATTVRPDTGVDGRAGHNAGNISLFVAQTGGYFSSDTTTKRFILNGGKGGPGGFGQDGTNGQDGGDGYVHSLQNSSSLSYVDSSTSFTYTPIEKRTPIDSSPLGGVIYFSIFGKEFGIKKFPEDGKDATRPGKPGVAGNGGAFTTVIDIPSVAVSGGSRGITGFDENGDDVPDREYYGGEPGRPLTAYAYYYSLSHRYEVRGSSLYEHFITISLSTVETKVSVKGKDAAASDPDILASYPPEQGADGSIQQLAKQYAWISPNNARIRLNYLKDAFLYGYLDVAKAGLVELDGQIAAYAASDEWAEVSANDQADLMQLRNEMAVLFQKLNCNLDYFGNPAGWVPMLSFEVTKIAFENEVDRALKALYLAYWFKANYGSQTKKIEGFKKMAADLKAEIDEAQAELNAARAEIPGLVVRSENLKKRQEILDKRLQNITDRLIAEAKENLEPDGFNKFMADLGPAVKFVSTICKVCPVYQPALGAAGQGLDTVYGAVSDGKISLGDCKDIYGAYKGVNSAYKESVEQTRIFMEANTSFAGNVDDIIANRDLSRNFYVTLPNGTSVQMNSKDYLKYMNQYYNEYMKDGIAAARDYWKTLQKDSASAQKNDPNSPLMKEFNKLAAKDVEYQAVITELNGADEKGGINKEIADLTASIVKNQEVTNTCPARIAKAILNLNAIQGDMSNESTVLDSSLLGYIADMEQRSRERLLKYHYYMAKAYEYRMLKPYTGELKMNTIMDKVIALVEAAKGNAGDTGQLSSTDFEALKALYTDQIANVVEQIYDDYIQNRSELSAPVSFQLPADMVARLNNGEQVTINLREIGLFLPQEENVRIYDFKVKEMKCHTSGDIGYFGYSKIMMEHSGVSKICKDGVNYLFRHYNANTVNPIVWGANYDAYNGSISQISPSVASQSLLKSILESNGIGGADNIMLYSRPSAWADIVISKSDRTSSGAKIVLDSIRFELNYDYSPKESDITELEIAKPYAPIKPKVDVLAEDRNQRSAGMGYFYRSYGSNQGSVKVSVPASYGDWVFVKWTDRYGRDIEDGSLDNPEAASVEVNMSECRSIRPLYRNINTGTVEPTEPDPVDPEDPVDPVDPEDPFVVQREGSTSNSGFFGCGSATQASGYSHHYHPAWWEELLNVIGYLLIPVVLAVVGRRFRRKEA